MAIEAWLEYRYDDWGEERIHGMIHLTHDDDEGEGDVDGVMGMCGDAVGDDGVDEIYAYPNLAQFNQICNDHRENPTATAVKDGALPPPGLVPYLQQHLAQPSVFGTAVPWTELYSEFANANVFPYQKIVVERIVREFDGRCLLSAEMGLGKTIMSILTAYYYFKNMHQPNRPSSILVVAPTSTFGAWQKAFKDWCGGLTATVLSGTKDTTCEDYRVVLTSYQTASKHAALLRRKWTVVIYDECHMLKNPDAQRTKSLVDVARKARSAILLSGTPRLNCSSELYTQLCCTFPVSVDVRPFLGTYEQYIRRYSNARPVKYGGRTVWEMGRPRFDEELNILLLTKMIRLTHDMVNLAGMPAKHRIMHYATISDPAFIREQQQLQARYDKCEASSMERKSIIMQQWRLVGQAKFPSVSSWCAEWLREHPSERLVVFAHSVDLLKRYQQFFQTEGYVVGLVDGSTPQQQRQDVISQLSSKDKVDIQVGLLSYGTCALGITLCPGSWTCVFAECEFTPALMEQAEAKLHRVGATRDVYCYWMIAKGTLDDMVINKVQSKTNSNAMILDRTKRRLAFEPPPNRQQQEQAPHHHHQPAKKRRRAQSNEDDSRTLSEVAIWRMYGLTLEEALNVRIHKNPQETVTQYVTRCTVLLDESRQDECDGLRTIKTARVTRRLGVKSCISGGVLVVLEPLFFFSNPVPVT